VEVNALPTALFITSYKFNAFCSWFVQHYLSYLNCLRVKEFCGASDSLFHCFDRNSFVSDSKGNNQDEKSRGFRYAALNLAVLHAQFGHK